MAKYWRAAIKKNNEKFYHLVYFSTEKDFSCGELVDWLKDEFDVDSYNCYLKHLNIVEYISNILTAPIATMHTFTKYPRATIIG